MDDFERGLGRAEDALGRNEPQIRSTLQRLDLDTSGLSSLREVQSWIETSRPDLRRRSETIRTERTEWGSAAGLPGELSAFDEALYGKAAHDPNVYAAIVKVTEAAENGEVDAKALAELEKRTGDATFAAALMNAMGAARFRKLMGKTVGHEGDKKVERLQIALGKTLGTASPKLSNAWRDELTSDLAIGWQEGYAISLALKYATSKYAGPEYGASSGAVNTAFLLAVAKKVDAWDREASKFPVGTDPGVTVALMEALSLDPAAAQDFFAGDPTALKHYLTERGMRDGGEALGKALEAAMLTFRDHKGSPQAPSRGYLSAKLASEFVHLEAERIEAGNPSAFVKPATTGHILAGYVSDINYVAQKVGDIVAPGVRGADNPSASGQDPWGAQFNLEELRRVMKEAFADSKAFTPVLAAQTAFTGWLLDHGAAEMTAGRGDGALLTNAKQAGAGFGMITDAAGLAKIEEGKELDEAQQRNMKVLMAVVNTGLAIPQMGIGPFTIGAVGAWTGMIEDSAKGDAETKARVDANTVVDQTQALMRDLTAQAMLKRGAFGAAEPAAKTHPWASLEGLEKGDDPRENPNNFLKEDGRTLMTMDEMIDKTVTNGADKDQRLEAYRRWLYEGPSGRPWRDVEDRLDQGFSNGFSQYGS
ncbi:hypothetical protein [Streptosporangium sp. 'caverna']|uniref:hypothetical protein n=1 Tax=Streptosporangium sp. 'caverna' TaxID=2202249 RepID=UPI000D7E1CE7|nr:hypothetical protein [Streptosporangium sp. 'caverna']AWS47574.1 hypothetical protein DKM19_46095 [Streptosporangium sp. 'caverna']